MIESKGEAATGDGAASVAPRQHLAASEGNAKSLVVALDAMGGDHGPDVVVPAAVCALENHPQLSLILVGQPDVLEPLVSKHAKALTDVQRQRVSIQAASQVVGMDEPPALALRGKKDSSMRVAINLVKDGAADACVSAGNTGALMATGRFVLKTLPNIDRPAICTKIPSVSQHTHMLDLGANVNCSAEHLFQFALMGHELARAIDDNPAPRVALLNVGEEDIKGNDVVKDATKLLAASDLNYVGFAEGDDVYHGDVDVVVCDGFVGNIALKTSEGVARMISNELKGEFRSGPLSLLAGLIAYPVLRRFRKRFDPRRYNGAILLGLRGIVIKSHGSADKFAFANAINIAVQAASQRVPDRIREHLEQRAETPASPVAESAALS